jgi:hypothetical protein
VGIGVAELSSPASHPKELTLHRCFRLSSHVIASLAVVAALVGCGSPDDEASVAGPPPNESVVFGASADTQADLGIAKWGFANDDEGDLMTYRGYSDRNEVMATVVQKLDRSDPNKYHFTLTMTGPKASATEKIDFSAHPSDDGKDAILVTLVTENTFDEGTIPPLPGGAHRLAHRSGGVVGRLRLLEAGRPAAHRDGGRCGRRRARDAVGRTDRGGRRSPRRRRRSPGAPDVPAAGGDLPARSRETTCDARNRRATPANRDVR